MGDRIFVWAGNQPNSPQEHDSPQKRQYTSYIDIFHVPTGQWTSQQTRGTPPCGITAYRCTVISNNIYYFGGWCGHDICYYNDLTVLDTLTLKWTQLQPTTDYIMKRASGGLISVDDDQLLTVGGQGSSPTHYHQQYQYIQLPNTGGAVRTNECNLFSLSTGKCPSLQYIIIAQLRILCVYCTVSSTVVGGDS